MTLPCLKAKSLILNSISLLFFPVFYKSCKSLVLYNFNFLAGRSNVGSLRNESGFIKLIGYPRV